MRCTYNTHIGETHNNLTILDYHKIGKGYYVCKCTCGNIKEIRCDHILNGRISSCGCKAHHECYRDLSGKRFGRLVVINKAYKNGYDVFWNCKCDCGKDAVVLAGNLTRGITKSCGCYKQEQILKALTKHGCTNTRLYRIYEGMKGRCYNKNEPAYKNYGGRGIKICEEWLHKEKGFETFKNWAINNGYSDELSIDRIDVNGNYEPSNCRWADVKTQSNNKRTSRIIEYKGQKKTMREWADETGISYQKIQYRLSVHKPLKEVFKTSKKEEA